MNSNEREGCGAESAYVTVTISEDDIRAQWAVLNDAENDEDPRR